MWSLLVSGQWSSCFLNNDVETCGEGSQVRNVYCLSALDEPVIDDLCAELHGLSPAATQTCTVPCKDQCTLSDWSDWTPCSHTCGPQGGTQMRTRQITGMNLLRSPFFLHYFLS